MRRIRGIRVAESTKVEMDDFGNSYAAKDLQIEGRLSMIEEKLNHVATKAWVLGGVVGGCVLAVGMAMAYLRLFG